LDNGATDPDQLAGPRQGLRISPDRGTTWDGPRYIDTSGEDAGYGDIFAKADVTFSVVINQGTLLAPSLKQYNL
jgi:hypothetical protein